MECVEGEGESEECSQPITCKHINLKISKAVNLLAEFLEFQRPLPHREALLPERPVYRIAVPHLKDFFVRPDDDVEAFVLLQRPRRNQLWW